MMKLFEQLQAHLATLSDEAFAKEWEEIKKLNLGGPTVTEYFEYARHSEMFLPYAEYTADVIAFSENSNADLSLAA